jgi:hypothetical protein
MSNDSDCPKCGGEMFWYPAINERGWRCCGCGHAPGEPSGYSPALDKSCIRSKVNALVHDAHDANFICISNGSAGDGLASLVAVKCIELDRFDQTTILRLLFETDQSHVDYWHKIGAGIRAGADPRDRCPGGRLATSYSNKNGVASRGCFESDCASCRASTDVPF